MRRTPIASLMIAVSLSVLVAPAAAHDCTQSGTVSWDRNHEVVLFPYGHFCPSHPQDLLDEIIPPPAQPALP